MVILLQLPAGQKNIIKKVLKYMASPFKKPIGIEVTDSAVKAVQIERKKGQAKILKLNKVALIPGTVERGRIKDEERLMGAFKELFSGTEPDPIIEKGIVFGLPENQLYTHTFKIPSHKKKERDDLVLKEARASIPLEKNDLTFSYRVMNKNKKRKEKTEILIVAANKRVVLEWQKLFQKLNLEIIAFDVKPLAIFRVLFPKKIEDTLCIINIGTATTDIAIFNEMGLRHSHTINVGGNNFTEAIAEKLQIEFDEAEKKKEEVGLTGKRNQIFTTLDKILKPMTEEIKELLNYFEQTVKQKIKKIILIGGSSELDGIVDYFNDNLDLTVKKAALGLIKKEMPLEYMESLGLALKNTDKKWIESPSIPIEEYSLSDWEQLSGSSTVGLPMTSDTKHAKEENSKRGMLITILIIGIICLGAICFYKSR